MTARRTPDWPPPLRPYLIGLGLILTAAVIAYLAFAQGLPFSSGYRVEAVFKSSSGLRQGSPVRVAGKDVGKVVEVRRGPGDTAVVVMRIEEPGRPVHTDATARIRPRVFLEGGYMIELSPGSPSAPELDDDGTLPLAQTITPVQFTDLLSVFDRPSRESMESTLDTFSQALEKGGAKGLRALAPELRPLLRDTAWIADAATGRRGGDLARTVAATNRIAGALAADPTRLGAAVDHLATFAETLRSRDSQLTATVSELRSLMRSAPGALATLDGALPVVERAAGVVTPALGDAPASLREWSEVLRELGGLAAPERRPQTLRALSAAFVDLPDMVGSLAAVFPTARPLSDCLSSHVVPTFESVVPDGELSSGRPVWQDFAHALVGLASASQNFDGNGHSLRYQFATGDSSLSTAAIPGAGPLLANAPSTLQSRPLPRADRKPPPYNDNASCAAQPPVDLAAASGPGGLEPAGRAQRVEPRTRAQLERLLRPRNLDRILGALK